MPEHDTGMSDPSESGSPQIDAAERRGEPLAQWQDSLKAVQGAAEDSMAELASLRRDLAAAVRSMRQAEAWDPERTEGEVSALAAHLERVQDRLAGRVDILRRNVEGAAAAAASSVRRLGQTYQRVRQEREASQDLYGRLVAPLTERLLALEAAMTELRSSLSSGLVDSAWIGSVRERLSGVERAIARLADRDPDQDALADLRQAMADIRLDLKEAAGPSQEAIAAVQGSLADLGVQVRHALAEASDRPAGDPEALEARLAEMQAALEANLERLAARLSRRLKSLEGPEGPSTAEREVAATNKALRKELEAFRKRIEGWGKPRTAPRLAEEVEGLEQRFGEMQRAVEQTIAGEVAKRVRASVDRRVRDIVGDLPERVRQTALKTVRESIREEVEGATGEAVREAMREVLREAADEAVREAADEAVRDALSQPASPPGPLNEPEPPEGDRSPRRRFGRHS